MSTSTPLALMTNDDLERIVMEEFSKAESKGFKLILDCDVFLARSVAARCRAIAGQPPVDLAAEVDSASTAGELV